MIKEEEHKNNLLECMSPIQDHSKYNISICNSLTPTPLKGNGYYDGKELVPPYQNFQNNYQKSLNLNNYPPFLNMRNDKFSPMHSAVLGCHNLPDEICGK